MGEEGVKRWACIVAALIVASCAAQPTPPPPPPQVINVPAPPPPPSPPPPPPDQCGAAALQYLVGRPRTDIPVPLQPSRRRVVCSTCPMTMDYSPVRQTILFDADSGLVTEVKCG